MNLHLSGSANGASKLTEDDVRQMRSEYRRQQPRVTVAQLADRYGVRYYTVWSAIKGLTWAHLVEQENG